MTSRNLVALAVLAAAAFAVPARADTIVLKSGDSFTGTITRVGADTVDVTTPFAGEIHVKRDAVKSLRSDAPVTIAAATGEPRKAFVAPTADGAGWQEAAAAAAPTPVAPPAASPAPAAGVVAGGKVYDLDLESYFLPVGPHWKNQLALGIVNTTGNTESTNFAAQLDFNYKVKPHELTVGMGGVYEVNGGTQTAGQFHFDAVYRRSLPEWDRTDRWYLFAENHELYDGIKGISYRITNSFGPGYYVIKDENLTLDLRAGPAYVCEKYFSGDTNSDISGLVGLRAVYKLNDRANLTQDVLYTTALTDAARYQITSETALTFKLPEVARGVGLKLGFRDDYDNAAAAKKNNDTRLTLSLTLDF